MSPGSLVHAERDGLSSLAGKRQVLAIRFSSVRLITVLYKL